MGMEHDINIRTHKSLMRIYSIRVRRDSVIFALHFFLFVNFKYPISCFR